MVKGNRQQLFKAWCKAFSDGMSFCETQEIPHRALDGLAAAIGIS